MNKKKLLLYIGIAITNLNIYSQTKIGFNINDAFNISDNSVAHYGISRISGANYHYVGLSGFFGLNFYTDGKERFKILRNGNLGIGTSKPKSKFHLYKGSSEGNAHPFSLLTVENSDHSMISILTPNDKAGFFGFSDTDDNFVGGMQYNHISNRLIFRTNNHNSDLIIGDTGNISIGSEITDSKLRIEGTKSLARFKTNQNGFFEIQATRSNPQSNSASLKLTSQNHIILDPNISGTSGNVGIGLDNPDMKLTVNGNIHAKEIKIDLKIPAPDYVFKYDYNLRSIKSVEKFIKKNNHLPEIPSAEQFKQNGLMIAEMNMSLLKKVEELTLYIIQQEKKMNKQKNQIEKLNTNYSELQSRIEKLEY